MRNYRKPLCKKEYILIKLIKIRNDAIKQEIETSKVSKIYYR